MGSPLPKHIFIVQVQLLPAHVWKRGNDGEVQLVRSRFADHANIMFLWEHFCAGMELWGNYATLGDTAHKRPFKERVQVRKCIFD